MSPNIYIVTITTGWDPVLHFRVTSRIVLTDY